MVSTAIAANVPCLLNERQLFNDGLTEKPAKENGKLESTED